MGAAGEGDKTDAADKTGIAAHYARAGLAEAIAAALKAAGKDLARLTPADFAPIDEFHVRGRAATAALAAKLALTPQSQVLDLGCGLGGAARHLAAASGGSVIGVDLSPDYCRAAAVLTGWLGLGERVRFAAADALALPFADRSFDVVATQHAAMNIADKPRLYAEVRRVLRPGGRLALYDAFAGETAPIHLPVPWARTPAQNHLATPEAVQAALSAAGFRLIEWQDTTALGLDWFAQLGQARPAAPPALSLRLLLGAEAPAMVGNLRRNLEDGRVRLAAALWQG